MFTFMKILFIPDIGRCTAIQNHQFQKVQLYSTGSNFETFSRIYKLQEKP